MRALTIVAGAGVCLGVYLAFRLYRNRSREEGTASTSTSTSTPHLSPSKKRHLPQLPNAEQEQPEACDGCAKPNTEEALLRCGGCRRAWFCSAKCQATFWPTHKAACTVVKALNKAQTSFKSGKYREALLVLNQAEKRASQSSQTAEAVNQPMANNRTAMWADGNSSLLVAMTELKLSNLTSAKKAFQLTLDCGTRAHDDVLVANCLAGMASVARKAREPLASIHATLEQAMAAADNAMAKDEAQALRAKASILSTWGVVNITHGGSDSDRGYGEGVSKGIDQLEEALAIRKRLGDPYQVCTTLINVGGTYMVAGAETKAAEFYEDAAAVAQQNGYVQVYVAVLINLANLYETGDVVKDKVKAANNRQTLSETIRKAGRSLPEQCVICLEDLKFNEPSLEDGTSIVIPECLHALHKKCFDLCEQHRCPTCMSEIDGVVRRPAPDDDGSAADEESSVPMGEAPVLLNGHSNFDLE